MSIDQGTDPRAAAFRASFRARRKARSISVQAVSDELAARGHRWERSAIAMWETQRDGRITLERALLLADILGVPLADMLTPPCEHCAGFPPAGFACRECGAEA